MVKFTDIIIYTIFICVVHILGQKMHHHNKIGISLYNLQFRYINLVVLGIGTNPTLLLLEIFI
jgi:hypothetical protein